jgi:hypothetical protein
MALAAGSAATVPGHASATAAMDPPLEETTIDALHLALRERRISAVQLVRRYADRVQSTHKGGRSTILFHFDH